MKTSKVKTITSTKEWSGPNGTTIYNQCIMENGDKINIGKKKALTAGEELTYELTGGADDQFEYKKAKSVQLNDVFNRTPKINTSFRPKDEGVITMLSCISSACTAVAQSSKGGDKAFILDMAESFFKAAMSKSSAEKPVQESKLQASVSINDTSNDDLPF